MTIRSVLYRADALDLDEIELDARVLAGLDERQLLWVDLAAPTDDELERVAALFKLRASVLAMPSHHHRPSLENYGESFRLCVYAAVDGHGERSQGRPLILVAGDNYVVSAHGGNLPLIEELRHREKGDTKLGELTAESFVASLLDRQLSTYFHAVERLERDVDQAEVAVLGRQPMSGFLKKMVAARQEISELRRLLKPHRDVIYGLARRRW